MLTLADSFTLVDKVAFAAATIIALALLAGAIGAFRFCLRRRSEMVSEDIGPAEDLIYPDGNLLSVLSFLIFNALVVFLALYVPWPLWIRLLIALPFLLMGGFSCWFAYVLLAHWWRTRRSSAPTSSKS
jgi:hypothetical protein